MVDAAKGQQSLMKTWTEPQRFKNMLFSQTMQYDLELTIVRDQWIKCNYDYSHFSNKACYNKTFFFLNKGC